jgi:MFS family permease
MRTPAVVASSVAGIAYGANFTNIGAVAERVASGYGVALATVGLFTTALAAMHAITQIPGGRLVDRIGARTLSLVAVGGLIVCNAMLLAAPVPALAISLRAVAGIFTGIGFVAGTDFIRSSGGTAVSQGIFGGVGYGSTAIPLVVVPQLTGFAGWRAPYVFAIVVGCAAMLLVATAERERPASRRAPTDDPLLEASMFTDLRLYRLAAMHGIGLLALVAGNWISTLFVRNFGVSVGVAGLMGALALTGGLATRPAAGWLVHHRPELVRTVLAASLVAGAAGTLVIAVAPSPAVALVGAAVLGFAAGVPFAPAMFGAGRVRADAPAAAVGLVNTLGNVAVVVGTPLLGLAFSLPGNGRIGFAAIGMIWLLGLLFLPRDDELGVFRTSVAEPQASH